MGRYKNEISLKVVNHTEQITYRYLYASDIRHFLNTKWKGHKVEVFKRDGRDVTHRWQTPQ